MPGTGLGFPVASEMIPAFRDGALKGLENDEAGRKRMAERLAPGEASGMEWFPEVDSLTSKLDRKIHSTVMGWCLERNWKYERSDAKTLANNVAGHIWAEYFARYKVEVPVLSQEAQMDSAWLQGLTMVEKAAWGQLLDQSSMQAKQLRPEEADAATAGRKVRTYGTLP